MRQLRKDPIGTFIIFIFVFSILIHGNNSLNQVSIEHEVKDSLKRVIEIKCDSICDSLKII